MYEKDEKIDRAQLVHLIHRAIAEFSPYFLLFLTMGQYRLKLKNVEQKLHDVRCKASKLQQQLGDSAAGYEKAKG